MKTIYIVVILFLSVGQTVFGQWTLHLDNNDSNTRRKLLILNGIILGRIATLTASNNDLTEAVKDHKEQVRLQYTKNDFDKGTGYVTTAGISALLSIGASGIARIPGLPYMTSAKQAYLDDVTMDKALLLALKSVSTTNIKSAKRQEIYQLRSKLLREFAKNDTGVRKTLFMSAAGIAVLSFPQFMDIYNKVKITENDEDTGQLGTDPSELGYEEFLDMFGTLNSSK